MESKLLNAVLLAFVVVLDAALLFYLGNPWPRLALGLLLLLPLVGLASHLGILFGGPASQLRVRRFKLLRSNVGQLLEAVKRLNWLTVDRDRGFRDRETVLAEIQGCEERMEELLRKVWDAAGSLDENLDTPPENPLAELVDEPQSEGEPT